MRNKKKDAKGTYAYGPFGDIWYIVRFDDGILHLKGDSPLFEHHQFRSEHNALAYAELLANPEYPFRGVLAPGG